MPTNLIQIKRSLNTATPGSLANGELAYTANGDVLFIGSNSGVVAVGGKRVPGTLTANQALVANATSGIDKVIVANLVPTSITANGVVSPGAGYYLAVDSGGNTFWAAPGTLAINVNAQYTWTNSHTFNNSVTVGNSTVNTALTNGSIVIGTSFVANTTRVSIGTSTGLLANGSVGTAGQILHSNGTTVYWAADDGITDVVAGAGLTGGGTSSQVTLTVGAGNGITVNADDVAVAAGTNGGLVSNSTGVWVSAGSGLLTNSTGLHVGSGNGISVAADAIAVTGGSTLVVNATGVHVNTANLSIATSQLTGDVALGTNTSGNYVATITAGNGISGSSSTEGGTPTIAVVAGTDGGLVSNSTGVFVTAGSGLVTNSTGLHVGAANGISVAADTVGLTTGSTLTVNSTGAHVNTTLSLTSLTTSGDVSIGGNLTILGDLLTINVATLAVEDSLIQLASNNTASDLVDIGFFGSYEAGDAGTHEHAGFFRDASDSGIFKIFTNLEASPTATVNTTGVGYTTGTLEAFLKSNGLISNATHVAITANSTVNVSITANSLTLATPLAATSGGVGIASYTSGDILVANTGNTLSKLALGTSGYVLQSNGTALVYDTLDGGTF